MPTSYAPEQIESASPNAYSGKAGAVVYEDPSVSAAWLVSIGKTSFNALADRDRDTHAAIAVRAADLAVQRFFRGIPLSADQGLLWPAVGASDARGRSIASDAIPRVYLEGARLLMEESAAGSLWQGRDQANVLIQSTGRSSTHYQGGVRMDLGHYHPEAFQSLMAAMPRCA